MLYNKILKIAFNTLAILVGLFLIFTINGYYEQSKINKKIEAFKSRGVFVLEDSEKYTTYYKVTKEYDYEESSKSNYDMSSRIVGDKADIIITDRNPMRDEPLLRAPIGYLAKNFFVGHATFSINDGGTRIHEVIGNGGPGFNVVSEGTNHWMSTEFSRGQNSVSPRILGIRIKEITVEQEDKMIEYTTAQLGKGYNYTFIFNRKNTYYCTDLISRAAKHAGVNINYDFLATTGNDMIISKNVYLFFYRETEIKEDGSKWFHVYYLDNE